MPYIDQPSDDQPLILHGYTIEDLIARGGTASVYRARTPQGELVAVKVMFHDLQPTDDAYLQRFEEEARIISALQHPHIVPLLDYWVDEGESFLVMPLINGANLYEYSEAVGGLSAQQVRSVVRSVAGALAASHEAGIVHRDVKPENILVDQNETVFLTDFGIARRKNRGNFSTRPGQILGTPGYLAPEQVREQAVTPATDQYALAVVLWELLAGYNPYHRMREGEMLRSVVYDPVPPLPGHNDAVNTVIQRATAKDPLDRYPTVQAFAERFLAVY